MYNIRFIITEAGYFINIYSTTWHTKNNSQNKALLFFPFSLISPVMKALFILGIVSLTLVACSPNTSTTETLQKTDTTQNTPPETPTVDTIDESVQKEKVDAVREGTTCGGTKNIKCQSPLFCKKEIETLEATGICISTVVDKKVQCGTEQQPVCGIVDQRKNAYLNECEAKRHGAEIVNKGFCGRKNTFEKPCEAPVLSVGVCDKYFTGYFFDGTKCQERPVQGCDIETPFESIEACNTTCG